MRLEKLGKLSADKSKRDSVTTSADKVLPNKLSVSNPFTSNKKSKGVHEPDDNIYRGLDSSSLKKDFHLDLKQVSKDSKVTTCHDNKSESAHVNLQTPVLGSEFLHKPAMGSGETCSPTNPFNITLNKAQHCPSPLLTESKALQPSHLDEPNKLRANDDEELMVEDDRAI